MKHTFYETTSYYHKEDEKPEAREYDMQTDVFKRTQILIVATTTANEEVKENDETWSIRKHVITELKTYKAQICTKKGDSSEICNYDGCNETKLTNCDRCPYHEGIDIGLKEPKDDSSKCYLTMVSNHTLKKMTPWLAIIRGGYANDKDMAQSELEILAEGTDLEEYIGKAEDYKAMNQYSARNLLYVCARRLI